MTAEEARRKTEESKANENGKYGVDLEGLYAYIDRSIGENAGKGCNDAYVKVYCREEPWRVIAYKRKIIRSHYETLGYSVYGAGFDEDGNYDRFLIGW